MLLSGLQVFFIVNAIKKILGDFARLHCVRVGYLKGGQCG